jgi:hypothetical protein
MGMELPDDEGLERVRARAKTDPVPMHLVVRERNVR